MSATIDPEAQTAESSITPDFKHAMSAGNLPPHTKVSFAAAAPASESSTPLQKSRSEPIGRQIAIVRQKSKMTKETSSPKPVFAEDINLGPRDNSAGDILVKNARTRVRVPRLKDGHAKGRYLEPDKKVEDKKLQLTFRMMLGVRVAVGRQANCLESQDLQEEDFAQVDKYIFPPAGTTGRLPTPSHKLDKTFKFRDYAPKVFKKLREQFGIDESSYMMSVAGNYEYLELITNSKSGSFFFYSHDQRYIIKNMKSAEAKFFRNIIPQYYEHHIQHPDSLLIRFCGMYMVKAGHRKIPFIVMECVEGGTELKVHTKYDLKGSVVHRTAKEGERVLKDNNIRENETRVHLGHQRAAFLKVIRADAEFLCSVNVMDYSMLLSIHDTSRPPEPVDRRALLERGYSDFFVFADQADGKTIPEFEKLPSSREPSLEAVTEGRLEEDDREELTRPVLKTARSCRNAMSLSTVQFRPDGGIESIGGGPKQIYWMGVIDVLQQYTTMKHAETYYKGIGRTRGELSCVAPRLYCERFVGFMEEITEE